MILTGVDKFAVPEPLILGDSLLYYAKEAAELRAYVLADRYHVEVKIVFIYYLVLNSRRDFFNS